MKSQPRVTEACFYEISYSTRTLTKLVRTTVLPCHIHVVRGYPQTQRERARTGPDVWCSKPAVTGQSGIGNREMSGLEMQGIKSITCEGISSG
jgi:hypothetical protein